MHVLLSASIILMWKAYHIWNGVNYCSLMMDILLLPNIYHTAPTIARSGERENEKMHLSSCAQRSADVDLASQYFYLFLIVFQVRYVKTKSPPPVQNEVRSIQESCIIFSAVSINQLA